MDTQWLSYHIIGQTFAEDDDFEEELTRLPSQPCYSKDELTSFYEDKADFQTLSLLLQSLELMIEGGENNYIIPAKLQQSTENPSADMNIGMCVRCVDNTMFAPIVFSAIQARIYRDISSKGKLVTSDYVQIALDTGGIVWQIGSKDAINFAVQRKPELDETCYKILLDIQKLIILTLSDLSPGTKVEIGKLTIVVTRRIVHNISFCFIFLIIFFLLLLLLFFLFYFIFL